MTSKVVISCAGKRAGSLSINTVSLPLFRFHASVCIVPFWQEKGPTNSSDMSFLESNSLPLLAYHEFWKKIWKILHWRSTTILFLLACYVWSVESDHNQLVGCSTSVWNSHLSSLKGRRSFSSGGWPIEWSLFKETQLGPGESRLPWTQLCLLEEWPLYGSTSWTKGSTPLERGEVGVSNRRW
jgi:hypothetical protein